MSAGPRVLITGASSGIGEALARVYARQGARLVLAARRVDRLDVLAKDCAMLGGEAVAIACDVCRDGDCDRAVAIAVERFGGLDIAIANAGFGVTGRLDALSLDDYRRQLETNVFGVVRTAQAARIELVKARGRFAIMGSVMGHLSMAGASPYAMSKFAVRALALSLRDEWRSDGVSVTLLSPGFVASDIRRTDNRGVVHADARETVPPWIIVPAERAARAMARAIRRRARERVITLHGKLLVWIYRHVPWLLHAVFARVGAERRKRVEGDGIRG